MMEAFQIASDNIQPIRVLNQCENLTQHLQFAAKLQYVAQKHKIYSEHSNGKSRTLLLLWQPMLSPKPITHFTFQFLSTSIPLHQSEMQYLI